MKNYSREYLGMSDKIKVVYIKLFGEEKGRILIAEAEERIRKIIKERNYDNRN